MLIFHFFALKEHFFKELIVKKDEKVRSMDLPENSGILS